MYSLLIFVPALGLVRTSLDSNGESVVMETDMLGQQQADKAMASEALEEAVSRREAVAVKGKPYWQTWLSRVGQPGQTLDESQSQAGLEHNGWTKLADKQELVGIALGGLGAGMGFGFPAGMSSSALAKQRFQFKFECMDAAAQQALIGAKREFEWKSHGHPSLGGKGIDHMEGHGIHVLHEKQGDYERASNARRYQMSAAVLNCNNLKLDIEQIVSQNNQMLAQAHQQAAQRLAAAGYSAEEMETARRGYHEQLFRDLSKAPDIETIEENHRKDVQELVANGSLKQAADYGLVQEYSSTMFSAAHSESADEAGGYFKFGSGSIQSVRIGDRNDHRPQVFAFKFTQDCQKDPKYRAEAQKLGDVSTINCKPGGKGLVLMHGQPTTGVMGDMEFTGDRLVMYLEQ